MSEQAIAQLANAAVLSPPVEGTMLQRKCACGNHTIAEAECESCKKEKGSETGSSLQRSAARAGSIDDVPPIVHEVLRSPGQPLDLGTRNFFESRFGRDFSRVRVHTDQRAAESAAAIGARAYESSESVVFSVGRYRPDTSDGQRLLAHELAHVVQQENSFAHVAQSSGPSVSRPDDPAEVVADRAADRVMSNGAQRASVAAMSAKSQPKIQRTVDDPQRFRQVHQSMFVG